MRGAGDGGGGGCLQGCRHEEVLHHWMLLDGGVKGRAGEGRGSGSYVWGPVEVGEELCVWERRGGASQE